MIFCNEKMRSEPSGVDFVRVGTTAPELAAFCFALLPCYLQRPRRASSRAGCLLSLLAAGCRAPARRPPAALGGAAADISSQVSFEGALSAQPAGIY
jgi:hypothetical protein